MDPRLFVDVLRGLAPDGAVAPARDDAVPLPPRETGPHAAEMFAGALPHCLSVIAISAQAGDAAAVAVAADALAEAGHRLGFEEVAFVSSAIARDARRGLVTHGRLVALMDLCALLDTSGTLAAQAARSA